MRKIGLLTLLMTILISTSSCTPRIEINADNCAGWERIDAWADRKVLSRDTKEQIATHNKFGEKACGWEKPTRPKN